MLSSHPHDANGFLSDANGCDLGNGCDENDMRTARGLHARKKVIRRSAYVRRLQATLSTSGALEPPHCCGERDISSDIAFVCVCYAQVSPSSPILICRTRRPTRLGPSTGMCCWLLRIVLVCCSVMASNDGDDLLNTIRQSTSTRRLSPPTSPARWYSPLTYALLNPSSLRQRTNGSCDARPRGGHARSGPQLFRFRFVTVMIFSCSLSPVVVLVSRLFCGRRFERSEGAAHGATDDARVTRAARAYTMGGSRRRSRAGVFAPL